MTPPGSAVIVGATGPTGIHLAAALRARGLRVRVCSRSRRSLEKRFSEQQYELVAADARDPAALTTAVEGCDVAFDCIGLPPDQMDQHAVTARHLAEAARRAGARCVQVSSYWAYLPLRTASLNERHPREGGGEWVRHRRAAEDILLEAGAAIVHLPDFFGPDVHTSTIQQPLQEAVAGKTMNWIGSPDVEREYAFIPDAMEIVTRLALCDEAYGDRWIVPGAGPLSGRRLQQIVSDILRRPVKLRSAGMWMLRLVSLFNSDLRGFLQMAPDYMKPLRFDAAKLRALLGDPPVRPYEDSVAATLDWLRRTQSAGS
ncbi:MAG: NAD(P)H-binding protein [Acidobacteria bacterium]|nr:NAD(P)H-binding protein [Acidobacteriota bacterium]